jgi:hypothetical protein
MMKEAVQAIHGSAARRGVLIMSIVLALGLAYALGSYASPLRRSAADEPQGYFFLPTDARQAIERQYAHQLIPDVPMRTDRALHVTATVIDRLARVSYQHIESYYVFSSAGAATDVTHFIYDDAGKLVETQIVRPASPAEPGIAVVAESTDGWAIPMAEPDHFKDALPAMSVAFVVGLGRLLSQEGPDNARLYFTSSGPNSGARYARELQLERGTNVVLLDRTVERDQKGPVDVLRSRSTSYEWIPIDAVPDAGFEPRPGVPSRSGVAD